MTDPDDIFDALRDETACTDRDLARLRALLPSDLSSVLGETRGDALPPTVAPMPPTPAPANRRWAWGLGAVAIAAAALFAVGQMQGPKDLPVALALSDADLGQRLSVGESVVLIPSGAGTVEGSTLSPRIAWEQGRIDVEVEPGKNIDLAVLTRDAEVRVKGTVFTVERDALGTTVRVSRGVVGVRCADGPEADVTLDQEQLCLPKTAGGLLGRARALQGAGADPSTVLESVELGLDRSEAGSAVDGELQVMRMELLAGRGDRAEALTAALAYLAGGAALRQDEILQFARDLGQGLPGCEALVAASDAAQLQQEGPACAAALAAPH